MGKARQCPVPLPTCCRSGHSLALEAPATAPSPALPALPQGEQTRKCASFFWLMCSSLTEALWMGVLEGTEEPPGSDSTKELTTLG